MIRWHVSLISKPKRAFLYTRAGGLGLPSTETRIMCFYSEQRWDIPGGSRRPCRMFERASEEWAL